MEWRKEKGEIRISRQEASPQARLQLSSVVIAMCWGLLQLWRGTTGGDGAEVTSWDSCLQRYLLLTRHVWRIQRKSADAGRTARDSGMSQWQSSWVQTQMVIVSCVPTALAIFPDKGCPMVKMWISGLASENRQFAHSSPEWDILKYRDQISGFALKYLKNTRHPQFPRENSCGSLIPHS